MEKDRKTEILKESKRQTVRQTDRERKRKAERFDQPCLTTSINFKSETCRV